MKKIIFIMLSFVMLFNVSIGTSHAKKSSKQKFVNPRVQNLSAEDQEMFSALTKKQQSHISEGKVETGYNAWMVTLALGEPYYKSENHPVYKDYEEVWLYTRNDIQEDKNEEKIIDPVNNWPSIHKSTRTKTCQVGDFFLLYDRGVVDKIVKDTSGKTYGSCTITTSEEFIPIVDGKPKNR